MAFILVIFIIILLLVFPVPLKIQLILEKGIFKFKIFNLNIYSSDVGIENRFAQKLINKYKAHLNKEAEEINKASEHSYNKFKDINKKLSFKKLYKNVSTNKFKALIRIYGDLTFGIEDAAHCAILYGLLCNVPAFLNILLSKIFQVKNIKINIIPRFNTTTLSFAITSIFYFNIAHIIYILFLLYKSFEIKEVTPN